MGKLVTNWDDAAADAYSFLQERRREYPVKRMRDLIDELAQKGTINRPELIAAQPGKDGESFVTTTLGHVTNAVHGPGPVPKGGWYSRNVESDCYEIHPSFAEAWKKKRRL